MFSLPKKAMENLTVLRIDDIPLLYSQIKELGIQKIIDKKIKPHGNWKGLSLGHLIGIWLCYLLSESDHRLSALEPWVEQNLSLLGTLSGQVEISSKDFTDDRLEQALDYLSDGSNWLKISDELNGKSLEIYDLDVTKTVRLDAAPMQGHQDVKVSKLFQYGYSKHHNPKLGMLKIMLACIDNEVNGFGYPLAHITVSGEQADDGLYIPLVNDCEQTFLINKILCRKLYVGDGKMGSKKNRYHIVQTKNDYLVPLSKIQLSEKERVSQINSIAITDYEQVYKEDKNGKEILVAQGFEQEVEMNYEDESGKVHKWKERRVFVLSTAYSLGQEKTLDQKLKDTPALIQDLVIAKQGKKIPKTKAAMEQSIASLLSKKGLTGLLEVEIKETKHSKKVRAYKDSKARKEKWSTFQLEVRENKEEIAKRKKRQGWQVYGTTISKEKLSFENVVWKYRYQNRVESRFNDLRNKVVPLVPIFLKKDNRVEALINLLMICLKICAIMEFKVAKKLKEDKEELANIYEGNPKRSTARPTAKRLLKQFSGVSIVILGKQESATPEIMMTGLKQVQLKIIELVGFKPDIYTELTEKMKLFFSQKKISET